MSLSFLAFIMLPGHLGNGGFDHAAVHLRTGQVYVAHTANDSVDVIDGKTDRYLRSIPNLKAVAGALLSEESDIVFTSNRGENNVAVFSIDQEKQLKKIPVGDHPNGLALDTVHHLLLVGNTSEPYTVTIVDTKKEVRLAEIPVPGRTRWAVYNPKTDAFYVNIASPPQIVVIDAKSPTKIAKTIKIPVEGPHGLDLDVSGWRLFCACDAKKLLTINVDSGKVVNESELSGSPDVIFLNPSLKHLYVAMGDPGVIDVFDTDTMKKIDVIKTEKGAHTIAFDPKTNKVYAFLPETHRAAVFKDKK
jgi:DNA-binding beta-propeller fold protein YncE